MDVRGAHSLRLDTPMPSLGRTLTNIPPALHHTPPAPHLSPPVPHLHRTHAHVLRTTLHRSYSKQMLKSSLGWGKQLWGKESAFFNLYLGTCLTAAAVATGYGLWNLATPAVVSAKTEQEEMQQQAMHESLEYTPL